MKPAEIWNLAKLNSPWGVHLERIGVELTGLRLGIPADETAERGSTARRKHPGVRSETVHLTPDRWNSWTDETIGIFNMHFTGSGPAYVDVNTHKPLLVLGLAESNSALRREFLLDNREVAVVDTQATIAYLPAGSRFAMNLSHGGFARSTSLIVDPSKLARGLGMQVADLPCTLQKVLQGAAPSFQMTRASSTLRRVAHEFLIHPHDDRFGELFARGKSFEFFWAFLQVISAAEGSPPVMPPSISRRDAHNISLVRALLEQEPHSTVSIDQLARMANTNRTRLRFIFKQMYGETIADFRNGIRMTRARQLLLETDLTVAQVSSQVGYADVSAFHVAFKKTFGCTPAVLRSTEQA